jgi:hypothetical protein
LSRKQHYDLANTELRLRGRRLDLLLVVAIVFGALGIFAIFVGGAQPQPSSVLVRNAFSDTQRIKELSPSLDGNSVLTLDNVATLCGPVPPSSDTMITLVLNLVPLKFADRHDKDLSVEGLTLGLSEGGSQFTFDMAHNRQIISVAGRSFIVTLLGINKLKVPDVTKPIEYVFGISEK